MLHICNLTLQYKFTILLSLLPTYFPALLLSIVLAFRLVSSCEAQLDGGCRICQLHLCREARPIPNKSPEYDIKLSD